MSEIYQEFIRENRLQKLKKMISHTYRTKIFPDQANDHRCCCFFKNVVNDSAAERELWHIRDAISVFLRGKR